jgi:hypothetical protein
MAYKMILIPSMKYGLPACCIAQEILENIQKSTLDKFLPQMGNEHGSPRTYYSFIFRNDGDETGNNYFTY